MKNNGLFLNCELLETSLLAVLLNILLAIVVSLASAMASAATTSKIYVFDDSNSELKALAVGRPKVLKINTEGAGPVGRLQLVDGVLSGELKVATDSLKTGVSLRDQHLKEKYIDVQKYPEAVLSFEKFKLSGAELKSGVTNKPFTGELLFHGEKKPVSGVFTIAQNDGESLDVQAQFKFKLTDFKVDIPSYLGIVVADELTVEVKAKPSLQKALK